MLKTSLSVMAVTASLVVCGSTAVDPPPAPKIQVPASISGLVQAAKIHYRAAQDYDARAAEIVQYLDSGAAKSLPEIADKLAELSALLAKANAHRDKAVQLLVLALKRNCKTA